jgi:hypothetical protein
MSISAQSILRRVIDTLQDTTSVRWPVSELVRYLNDAQREVILYRPDAAVTNASVPLVTGSRQNLPVGGTKLVEVVRNSAGTKRAVRMVNREILDAQLPGWHAQTGVTEILHYMYDPREPRVFYVYPPAAATGAAVDLIYAAMPADIAEPSEGALYTAVTGSLGLPDIYGNAVQDYVLYRAYTKDSEYAGNAARAQAHYGAFANALGVEVKATVAVAPNPTGNPNRTAMVQG